MFSRKTPCVLFPELKSLALTQVSFKKAAGDIAGAFDLKALQTLKLTCCPYYDRFLEEVMIVQPTGLKEVTIFAQPQHHGPHQALPIQKFIASTTELERLELITPGLAYPCDFWQYIRRHKSSLKGLVLHQRPGSRGYSIYVPSDPWDPVPADYESHCSYTEMYLDLMLYSPALQVFSELRKLEFLGICCDMNILVSAPSINQPHSLNFDAENWFTTYWFESVDSFSPCEVFGIQAFALPNRGIASNAGPYRSYAGGQSPDL